jgi:hypothetical protein
MNDIEWIGTARNVETGETQGFTVTSQEAAGYSLANIISDVEYRLDGGGVRVWKVIAIEEVSSV